MDTASDIQLIIQNVLTDAIVTVISARSDSKSHIQLQHFVYLYNTLHSFVYKLFADF